MKKILFVAALFLYPGAAVATDITWDDKVTGGSFSADDANAIKTAVNSKADKTAALVGDCTVGPCLDGSTDGGNLIKLWAGTGSYWTALQGGAPAANRSWRLPIDAPPSAGETNVMTMDEYGQMGFLAKPSTSGYVLSSTDAGVLSWVANGAGDDLGSATYSDVVGLWTTCSGYLKSDGTCDTPSGSATYPSATGIVNWTGSAWGTGYTLDTDLSSVSASDDSVPSAKATKAALDLKANASSISFVATSLSDLKYDPDTGTADDEYALITNTGTVGDANDATVVPTLERAGALFQAADSDLSTWAGITPGIGVGTFLGTPSSSNLASAVTGETGSGALVFGTSPTFTTSATMADGGKLIFDESSADPDDADVELSATDGVLKFAAANGANNEDITIDLDQTANTAILGSSTGLTLITTGSIPLNGAIKVVAKDADYTIGTDNANEAYGAIFFNTAASTRTFTLPSASAGMSVCVRNAQGVSQILRLDAGTGDYIVKSTGARTSASGEYYGATADAKSQVCVVAYDSTDWYVTSEVGTWTEE